MEGLYIYITKSMDYSNANVATRLKAKVKRKPTCLQLQQLTDWPTEKDSCLEFEFGHKNETGLFHLSLSFFHVDGFFLCVSLLVDLRLGSASSDSESHPS